MARYLPEKNLLFQHIPRTGGMWIEKAIDAAQLKKVRWVQKQPDWICRRHALLSHYFVDQMTKIDRIFTVVRHPVAYYKSVWKFLADQTIRHIASLRRPSGNKKWTWHPHRSAALRYQTGMSFREWTVRMMTEEPMWYSRLVEQYVGPEGGEFVDFIGRTESLVDDFYLAMEVFHIPLSDEAKHRISLLGHINSGGAVPESNPAIELAIEQVESDVIRRFYSNHKVEQRYYHRLLNTATYKEGSESVHIPKASSVSIPQDS